VLFRSRCVTAYAESVYLFFMSELIDLVHIERWIGKEIAEKVSTLDYHAHEFYHHKLVPDRRD
jgi:hypothetical protein